MLTVYKFGGLDYRWRARQSYDRWVKSKHTLPDLERNVWFFLMLAEEQKREQQKARFANFGRIVPSK